MAITNHIRDQSRAEITSKVDCIARFPSEACTDTEDDEEETKRREITRTDISVVLECVFVAGVS